jgi:rhodanese-related sulfurtransferase/DNA-binding transcriptional ArsR family regulator
MYDQFARVVRAMANPHRLELIDLLAQGERTVEDLAREASLSIANTSQHLQTLRAAQLVEVRREGLYAFYRLGDERVFQVWQSIRDLGEARLAEIDRIVHTFLANRADLEAVSAGDLVERMQSDGLVVLDVRPPEEYRAGHIPGARSVPVSEVESALKQIPPDHEVIAYCRGPYCVFSDEAVELLRAHGYNAKRLRGGLPDWRAAGLPVESSTY